MKFKIATLIVIIGLLLGVGTYNGQPAKWFQSSSKISGDNYWVDRESGILHIVYTDVEGEDTASQWERQIREADKQEIRNVVLHLNNSGGSGFIMFDIVDTVELLKKELGIHVTTIARGMIASAAVPLFLLGDTRIIYPSTFIMIHPCGGWNHPMLEDCDRYMIIELTSRYCALVADKTERSFEWCWEIMAPEDPLKNSGNNQYWFFAEEALEYGFATEIAGQAD